jgi:hypothetical protein
MVIDPKTVATVVSQAAALAGRLVREWQQSHGRLSDSEVQDLLAEATEQAEAMMRSYQREQGVHYERRPEPKATRAIRVRTEE